MNNLAVRNNSSSPPQVASISVFQSLDAGEGVVAGWLNIRYGLMDLGVDHDCI